MPLGGSEVGIAYVTLAASAKGLVAGAKREVEGPGMTAAMNAAGAKHGGTMGRSLLKGLSIGLAGGAIAGLAGFAAILKTGMGEVKDASAGQAQLAAGIKSTGGAAGVTVPELEALASSIQNYSGQTDDSIVAAEQLLLTFTNIKNVGADKIFDQTTIAAADMAAKMGGDASAYAIQLGKALNDPIKGVTALQRVGVSFTESQKKQIAAMVEAGDVAGAQKLILKELSVEFGGAAKAAGDSIPGGMEKAKRAFEDLAQGAVETLMPIVLPAIQGITAGLKFLAPYIQKAFAKIVPFFTAIGSGVRKIFAAFKSGGLVGGLQKIGTILGGFLSKLVGWVREVAPKIAKQLVAWGKEFFLWIGPMIPPMLAKLGGLIARFAQWFISDGLPMIRAKLVEWAKAFGAWIGPALPGLLADLGRLLARIIQWIVVDAIPAIVINLGKLALGILQAVGTALAPLFRVISQPFIDAWNWLSRTVGGWAEGVWTWISAIPGKITSGLSYVWAAVTSPFVDAWTWMTENGPGVWMDKLKEFVKKIPGYITSGLIGLWDAFVGPFQRIWDWINNHIVKPAKAFFDWLAGKQKNSGYIPGSQNLPGKPPGFSAAGGLFTSPYLTWVAEAGPELLLPLSSPSRTAQLLGQAGLLGAGAGNSTTYHIGQITIDGSTIKDFDGLIASIQAATKMRGR